MQRPTRDLREAMLWRAAADGGVDCFLCAHRCHIGAGRRGVCGVRENRGGTLYTLVYDHIIAAHVDPIEKKPLYHVMPGTRSYSIATVGCNFRCGFCQNWSISQDRDGVTAGRRITPEAIVAEAQRHGCASIAYTYTEPTIFFELAHDVAQLAHERGLLNVFVTNGYQTPETIEKMVGRIDAANVDLKAFDDDFYRKLCKARLAAVLEAIRLMHAKGIFVEITTLVIPGENDTLDELRHIAQFIASLSPDIPWHVSRFHPDFEAVTLPPTPPGTIFKALEIGEKAGLRYVYAGNLPAGSHEHTRCPRCRATVIERTGFLVTHCNLKLDSCGACGAKLPLVVGMRTAG